MKEKIPQRRKLPWGVVDTPPFPGGPCGPTRGVSLSFVCSLRVDLPVGRVDLYSPVCRGWEGGGVLGEVTVMASPLRRRGDHPLLKGAVSVGSQAILG